MVSRFTLKNIGIPAGGAGTSDWREISMGNSARLLALPLDPILAENNFWMNGCKCSKKAKTRELCKDTNTFSLHCRWMTTQRWNKPKYAEGLTEQKQRIFIIFLCFQQSQGGDWTDATTSLKWTHESLNEGTKLTTFKKQNNSASKTMVPVVLEVQKLPPTL